MASFGLLAALLFLSLKTGLILGSSGLSRSSLAGTSAGLGAGTWLLALAFAEKFEVLASWLENNTWSTAVMLSLVLIYFGLAGAGFPLTRPFYQNLIAALPCPLCLLALVLTVIVLAPVVGISTSYLGGIGGMLFAGLTYGLALTSRHLARSMKIDLHRLFDDLLIVLGTFTLTMALLIPNIVEAARMNFRPLKLTDPLYAGLSLGGLAFATALGYFLTACHHTRAAVNLTLGQPEPRAGKKR